MRFALKARKKNGGVVQNGLSIAIREPRDDGRDSHAPSALTRFLKRLSRARRLTLG
jgi:hypothetical protein